LVFQFKQITLDTVQYQLYLSGKPISVEPQVFDLLVYLIENRDRVVGRDELLENLWKGKVVTDAALGVCLKDARKAIGDSGTKQAIIKTFHGRGYQFIAEVSESTPSQPLEKNEAMATSGILELPVKPSIAVLPFSNLSNDAQQECLADGMTNEIITGLSKVPGLFVIANHSMMVYKDRTIDIKEVGREQGVRYVLEGSIRVVGNQIRVTAQLIDATTGLHLWAEGYQRELDDIFTVQDEITHNIVVELQVKLITGEYSRLETRTNSVKAWELVIRSRPLIDSHVRDDAMAAKQLLERALELDNNYCAAWTMLGWVYWEESVWEWSAEPKKSMQIYQDTISQMTVEQKLKMGIYRF